MKFLSSGKVFKSLLSEICIHMSSVLRNGVVQRLVLLCATKAPEVYERSEWMDGEANILNK